MNSHKHYVESALKRRAVYLARVARAQMMAGIGLTIAVVFGSIALIGAIVSLLMIQGGSAANLGSVIFLACVSTITAGGWRLRQREAHRARSIPYVPPAREQIAALPAVEVLVRGSRPPSVLPSELLRPGKPLPATNEAALLRAEQPQHEEATLDSQTVIGNGPR